MSRLIRVEAKPEYVLFLKFTDGTEGEISLANRLFGPMFEPLKEPSLFKQVTIDTFGAVCWPNQADLAPDALYTILKQQKVMLIGSQNQNN